jgi:hypothetical protein
MFVVRGVLRLVSAAHLLENLLDATLAALYGLREVPALQLTE